MGVGEEITTFPESFLRHHYFLRRSLDSHCLLHSSCLPTRRDVESSTTLRCRRVSRVVSRCCWRPLPSEACQWFSKLQSVEIQPVLGDPEPPLARWSRSSGFKLVLEPHPPPSVSELQKIHLPFTAGTQAQSPLLWMGSYNHSPCRNLTNLLIHSRDLSLDPSLVLTIYPHIDEQPTVQKQTAICLGW